MNIYRIALFGHRDLYTFRDIEEKLSALMYDILKTKDFIEIYIGRNGDFDTIASSVIRRVRDDIGYDNTEMILVLPYLLKDTAYYEDIYDSVFIPEELSGVHPKAAITKRNRYMINRCDLYICYVNHEFGGAYTALKYAQKQHKPIVNLALDTIDD